MKMKNNHDEKEFNYSEFSHIEPTPETTVIHTDKEYVKENLDLSLNENLFKFVELERSSGMSSLSGKQKRIGVDIAGRFFKNYFALISLIVFASIFLISIIAPAISQFGSNTAILPIDYQFISNLPPSYAPIVTEVLTTTQLEHVEKVLGALADKKELTPNGD
jgi:oligopeptide transport system permease protein